MTTPSDTRQPTLVARLDQGLIGVIVTENDRETIAYFADEATADAMLPARTMQRALDAIGAWSHLDWDDVDEALDRIRHESTPTPPIEDI
jgi:hypothetical protein